MTTTTDRPTLSLRKVDEAACVNAATYWTLTLSTTAATYELRINHAAPADEFMFVRYDGGDAWELMTGSDYVARRETAAQNEPFGCDRDVCGSDEPDADLDDDGWRCAACHAASLQAAEAALLDRNVEIETDEERSIRHILESYWTALPALVDLQINTFATGWRDLR